MKALLLKDKGTWRDMLVEEFEKPVPAADEILVKVKAAGLNPVDYKTGENGSPAWSYPHILGLDAAGVIEETGSEVTEVKNGDRVVFLADMARKGAFAEYIVTKAHTVSVLPEEVSFTDAAALPVAAYTAYQALFFKLHIQKEKSILIHAGAGGVGGFAIQLAKYAGLTVITTASEENHAYVKQLGADFAIDYKKEDFVEKTKEYTNGLGVNYVLDTVGRENATKSLETLAFNGHIAFIAGQPEMNESISFAHPVSFHHVALGSVYQSGNPDEEKSLKTIGDHLVELLIKGEIKSLVNQVISLEEVPEGLEELETRKVKGKIVAEIN
ncbi:zinc-binding alcohol dehydrogenase [Jeotgalibacillus alimentarius]|uniref:Zinc-binding alcohol dehydrogenase n=1 Tax=Jeotgalibacillus alimentarius TaxID=135826 RepID=A0A0C2W1V3_9BACL|nr:zinc-binding dehydrogenase [Jeotgalibacillus alimentarius]KIL50088.1 zinc-binding alcohol dehydrogenase [Jeotgalibacillus alimentarius]